MVCCRDGCSDIRALDVVDAAAAAAAVVDLGNFVDGGAVAVGCGGAELALGYAAGSAPDRVVAGADYRDR